MLSQSPASGAAPPIQPKMSVSAVASLVLGLVLCCPLTSIGAIVLGAVGLSATKARVAAGRGLAIAGLTLGILGAALQAGFGLWAYTTVYAPLLEGPATALRAAVDGGGAAMLEKFVLPEDGDPLADAEAFASAVTSRYGALVSCDLDQTGQAPTPDASRPEFEADFDARFERGTVRVRSCTQITDGKGRLTMKLLWIEIIDPARGDLRFPKAPPKQP